MAWTNTNQAVALTSGIGQSYIFRTAFASAATTAARDVVLHSANAPFLYRICDVKLFVTTTVALATAQLRTAISGGGSTVLGEFDAALPVNVPMLTTDSATATVAQGGTLVLRVSDTNVGGEIVVFAVREA